MNNTERKRLIILTLLLLLQPFLGPLFPAEAFNSYAARMLVYTHLTITPLPTDLPLSSVMGPVVALLVILCAAGGLLQLLWKKKTHFLRALYIFTFIWIILRGALYVVILPGSDARLPLLVGLVALTAWGWVVMKTGNPMFRTAKNQ
ncbi:MAG: hypothetical protein MUC87_14565 [Bacteroidia bacterium]|jgi:hypothetical protein|nr:hypothetical protein [Bacteroidia bacterium]